MKMTRIYGDANRTVSRLTIEGTDFECQAEELRYADYSEKFPGCSAFCLPAGVHECVCRSTEFSPLTLMVRKCAGHRCTPVGWSERKRRMVNAVIVESRAKFDEMQRYVYSAYCREEDLTLEIVNDSLAMEGASIN